VLATVAAALAPSTPVVLVGIAFAGIGTAAAAPSLVRLAGRAVDPASRGAAVGTVTTIGYLGFVLAPALVGAMAGAASLPVALAMAPSVPPSSAWAPRAWPSAAGGRRGGRSW